MTYYKPSKKQQHERAPLLFHSEACQVPLSRYATLHWTTSSLWETGEKRFLIYYWICQLSQRQEIQTKWVRSGPVLNMCTWNC